VHFGGWTRADILLEIPAMNPRLLLLAVTLAANCVFAVLLLRPSFTRCRPGCDSCSGSQTGGHPRPAAG
jgi:hypothetical protein